MMARYGHIDAIKHLITLKVDLTSKTQSNWSAVKLAVRYKHHECAEALLKSGAEIDAKDDKGRTAMHSAVFNEDLKGIELLLAHKASPSIPDKRGKTPLMTARELESEHKGKYTQIIKLLEDVILKDEDFEEWEEITMSKEFETVKND